MIAIKKLSKYFGKRVIFDDLNFILLIKERYMRLSEKVALGKNDSF